MKICFHAGKSCLPVTSKTGIRFAERIFFVTVCTAIFGYEMEFFMKGVCRFTSIILLFVLVAGLFGGCGGQNDKETAVAGDTAAAADPQSARVLKLPYSKSEPLNPYKAASLINIQLSALIYDCLYRADGSCRPVAVIAQDFSANGLAITVNIKTGIVFSTGEALSADDVIYSFKQAQGSAVFAQRLSNFTGIKKAGASGVVFTLNSPSPYAVNCLDFPVIKNNDTADIPAGSGRYTVREDKGRLLLEANTSRLGGFSPIIKSISLEEIIDTDNLNYSLQIGNIDFAFSDLSNGSYQRINAAAVEVPLNNLVYLGLNSSTVNLQNPAVRKAISLLIDKKSVAATAFQGHARAAFTPFNPDFWNNTDYMFERDATGAVELLEQAGYEKVKSSGVRYSGTNNQLTFRLLVNADNPFKTAAAQQIAQELFDAGIKATVSALALDAYKAAVQAGSFDMYLGEMLPAPDMSLAPLLAAGGSVSFGINTAGESGTAYSLYLNGGLDLRGFCDIFTADLPFIPLCYRNGISAYSRELAVPQVCSAADVFCDIQNWSFPQ